VSLVYLSLISHQNGSLSSSNKHKTNHIGVDDFMLDNNENMILGPDGSGDILNFTNEFLQEIISDYGRFHIITADAGIDCTVCLNFIYSNFYHF
jgi:hypothetical protein